LEREEKELAEEEYIELEGQDDDGEVGALETELGQMRFYETEIEAAGRDSEQHVNAEDACLEQEHDVEVDILETGLNRLRFVENDTEAVAVSSEDSVPENQDHDIENGKKSVVKSSNSSKQEEESECEDDEEL
jgi:hypothetical protein